MCALVAGCQTCALPICRERALDRDLPGRRHQPRRLRLQPVRRCAARYPGPEAALAVAGYPRTGGFSDPAHLSSIPVRERYRGDRMDLSAICRSIASWPIATVVSCSFLGPPALDTSVTVEAYGAVGGVGKPVPG